MENKINEVKEPKKYNAHNVRKLGLSGRMLREVIAESSRKGVDTAELESIFSQLEALITKVGGRIK